MGFDNKMGCGGSRDFDPKTALTQLELREPLGKVRVGSKYESILLPHYCVGSYYTDDIKNDMYFYFENRFRSLLLGALAKRTFDKKSFGSIDALVESAMRGEAERREILALVRRKGVTQAFRWSFWRFCASSDADFRVSGVKEARRREIFERLKISASVEVREIVGKDSGRTSKGRPLFCERAGVVALTRVAEALGMFFPDLGYVQGMNFLVALALEVSGVQEFESWNFLVDFLKRKRNLFFGIYAPGFPLTLCLCWMFHKMLEKIAPKTERILQKAEIPDQFYLSKWFISFFTILLPKEFLIRAWDFMLISNFLGPVYVALSIFLQLESVLEQSKPLDFIERIQQAEKLQYLIDFTTFVKQLKSIESLFSTELILTLLDDYNNSIDPESQRLFAYYHLNLSSVLKDPSKAQHFASDFPDFDSLPIADPLLERFSSASKDLLSRIRSSEQKNPAKFSSLPHPN